MIADRRIALLLTSLALLMSTGCQAITTIFETGVWVGVILVVVVLGAVAFVVSKIRGGGGPPRGTIAAVGGMLLLGTALTAAPRSYAQSPSPARVERAGAGEQQQEGEPAHEEILLQGCVARDDGWRPKARSDAAGARGAAASPAEDRGELFVLRDASRVAADAGGRPADRSGGGGIYRLLPRSGVSLSTFERQRIEVRGRLRDADDPDETTSAVDHRNSQAVQGGQMQAVGQTMSPGQGGQSGQSTATPGQAKTQAASDGDAGDTHPTVIVTSVRLLAPTCRVDER